MALDGVSLTVNAVAGETFSVLVIPHTLAVTTLGERRAGERPQPRGRPHGPLRGSPCGRRSAP